MIYNWKCAFAVGKERFSALRAAAFARFRDLYTKSESFFHKSWKGIFVHLFRGDENPLCGKLLREGLWNGIKTHFKFKVSKHMADVVRHFFPWPLKREGTLFMSWNFPKAWKQSLAGTFADENFTLRGAQNEKRSLFLFFLQFFQTSPKYRTARLLDTLVQGLLLNLLERSNLRFLQIQ